MASGRSVFTGISCAAAVALVIAGGQFQFLSRAQAQSALEHPGDAVNGGILALRLCASCHSLGPGASPKPAAPNFASIKQQRSRNQIKTRLFAPHGQMPPPALSRRDIEDAAAYIKSVGTELRVGRSGEI